MKQKIFGLLVIAVAITLSAFTYETDHKATSLTQMSYTWHKYNNAGTAELVPAVTFTGSDLGARQAFNCPEADETICARAYNGSTPLDIYILKPIP